MNRLLRNHSLLLAKVLRLVAFVSLTQMGITLVVARHVRAEVQSLMLSAGAQMMHLGEQARAPRTIRLNGAQIRLRVEQVPDLTLEQALDHFHARCRARNGRFYEQLTEEALRKMSDEELTAFDGVLRAEGDGAGAVACFDVGDTAATPSSLLARAQRFVDTGDLSSFGELRYVRIEQTRTGVFAVMMWTDGPMDVKQLFPAEGDAPGMDFTDLPRPPNSRRILSAWEEGQAPALNMYESRLTGPELDSYYRRALAERGWTATHAPVERQGAHGLLVMRDGVTVTISNSSLGSGEPGITTVMPTDTRGDTASVP